MTLPSLAWAADIIQTALPVTPLNGSRVAFVCRIFHLIHLILAVSAQIIMFAFGVLRDSALKVKNLLAATTR